MLLHVIKPKLPPPPPLPPLAKIFKFATSLWVPNIQISKLIGPISSLANKKKIPCTIFAHVKLATDLHGCTIFKTSLRYACMHYASLQGKPAQQASCKLAADLMISLASKCYPCTLESWLGKFATYLLASLHGFQESLHVCLHAHCKLAR